MYVWFWHCIVDKLSNVRIQGFWQDAFCCPCKYKRIRYRRVQLYLMLQVLIGKRNPTNALLELYDRSNNMLVTILLCNSEFGNIYLFFRRIEVDILIVIFCWSIFLFLFSIQTENKTESTIVVLLKWLLL
jgi:hypothetical protein